MIDDHISTTRVIAHLEKRRLSSLSHHLGCNHNAVTTTFLNADLPENLLQLVKL